MTTLHMRYLPPLVGIMLAVAAIQLSPTIWTWWHTSNRAIDWLGVKVHTPVVRPGEELRITYTARVNRSCPSDLRGFLIAPDGTFPVRFPMVRGGYTSPAPTPVEITVAIQIPMQSDPNLAPLKSGPHIYRTAATRYCPYGFEDDYSIPDARFQLEVP